MWHGQWSHLFLTFFSPWPQEVCKLLDVKQKLQIATICEFSLSQMDKVISIFLFLLETKSDLSMMWCFLMTILQIGYFYFEKKLI